MNVTRKKILPWGDVPNAKGRKIVVGNKFVEAFKNPVYPWRRIPADVDHCTVPGTAAFSAAPWPKPILGYGPVEIAEGDGVYYSIDHWIGDGAKTAGQYEDLSAVPMLDADGNVIAIISVGFCPNGAVPEITMYPELANALAALSASITQTKTNTTDMDKFKPAIIALLKSLGVEIADGISDDDLFQAIGNFKPTKPDPKPDPKTADPQHAAPLSAGEVAKAVSDALAPLTRQLDTETKNRMLMQAKLEGRDVSTLNDTIITALSVTDLAAQIAKFPAGKVPIVPLSGGGKETPLSGDDNTITPERREWARQCGMKPEDVWPQGDKK